MRRRIKATIVATVLIAGGTTYYVVHEQQIAACRPTVNQVHALWDQASTITSAEMSPSPGYLSDQQLKDRFAELSGDDAAASYFDRQAASIIVGHASCFDGSDVTTARQWLKQ